MKKIRNLFFKGVCVKEIATLMGLSIKDVECVIDEENYKNKRLRYYVFLIKWAYRNQLSIEAIAAQRSIDSRLLKIAKRKAGIKTQRFNVPNKRITEDTKKKMLELYQAGKSSGQIAKDFGYKTSKTVLDVLSAYQEPKRQKSDYTDYNENLFNKLDSHEKAYILGLLYTDGYVIRDYQGIAIQLTEGDTYLLERLAKIFGESSKVSHINCDSKRKRMPNVKDMSRLSVYSPKISLDLKKFGVTIHKSYDLAITSKIPKKYIYSFARGVIDGDGTLGIYRNWICCKFSTMSPQFAYDFCRLGFEEPLALSKSGKMTQVYVGGGRKNAVAFLKKMYKYKFDLYLERKYAIVQDLIS